MQSIVCGQAYSWGYLTPLAHVIDLFLECSCVHWLNQFWDTNLYDFVNIFLIDDPTRTGGVWVLSPDRKNHWCWVTVQYHQFGIVLYLPDPTVNHQTTVLLSWTYETTGSVVFGQGYCDCPAASIWRTLTIDDKHWSLDHVLVPGEWHLVGLATFITHLALTTEFDSDFNFEFTRLNIPSLRITWMNVWAKIK